MIKVKNVRPGVVIIADAGLRLSPGETADIEVPTKQTQQAIADGMLAKVETDADSRSRARTAPKATPPKDDAKPETKGEPGKPATESPNASG